MKAVRNNLLRLCLLWVAVVVVATGLPGTVLCVGEDGHLFIEAAHHGHCHDDTDHQHDAADEDAPTLLPDHTTSQCTDITLSSLPITTASGQARSPLPARVIAAIASHQGTGSGTGLYPRKEARTHAVPGPGLSGLPPHLSTTVLRT